MLDSWRIREHMLTNNFILCMVASMYPTSRTWVSQKLILTVVYQECLTISKKTVYSIIGQLLSHVLLLATPWTAACQASLSFTVSWSLLKLSSTELVTLSNHLILCHPLLLLLSTFTRIRVFSNELALCIRWPKYWSFSFIISPSNEYSGLISFRIDWFYLFAVQGTPKSLLQHHSSKASILWCSAFLMVQL